MSNGAKVTIKVGTIIGFVSALGTLIAGIILIFTSTIKDVKVLGEAVDETAVAAVTTVSLIWGIILLVSTAVAVIGGIFALTTINNPSLIKLILIIVVSVFSFNPVLLVGAILGLVSLK